MTNIEQRYSIKFCVKLKKTPTETYDMLKAAYEGHTLSRTQVFEWHKRFRDGRDVVEDDEGRGRPNTSVNEKSTNAIAQVVRENPRLSVRKIAGAVDISVGSAHTILHEELGMSRVCARWVPRLLTIAMREHRVESSREILEMKWREGEEFLRRIVTGDEVWLHFYDPETKQQSSVWKTADEKTPVKPRATKSAGKVMAVIFFDSEGILLRHLFPAGQTVNATAYCEILKSLVDAIRRKRPKLQQGGWRLLHDNAPVHTAHLVAQFIQRNNIDVLPHPPYSPDLAPCDFWLFPTMKSPLRGRRFGDLQELSAASGEVLRDLPKEAFFLAFQKWSSRMQKCIDIGGGYVEKE